MGARVCTEKGGENEKFDGDLVRSGEENKKLFEFSLPPPPPPPPHTHGKNTLFQPEII